MTDMFCIYRWFHPLKRNDQDKKNNNTVLKTVFFLWQHINASYYSGSNETSHYENICLTLNDNKNINIKLKHTWVHNLRSVFRESPKLYIQLIIRVITLQCAINSKEALTSFILTSKTYKLSRPLLFGILACVTLHGFSV